MHVCTCHNEMRGLYLYDPHSCDTFMTCRRFLVSSPNNYTGGHFAKNGAYFKRRPGAKSRLPTEKIGHIHKNLFIQSCTNTIHNNCGPTNTDDHDSKSRDKFMAVRTESNPDSTGDLKDGLVVSINQKDTAELRPTRTHRDPAICNERSGDNLGSMKDEKTNYASIMPLHTPPFPESSVMLHDLRRHSLLEGTGNEGLCHPDSQPHSTKQRLKSEADAIDIANYDRECLPWPKLKRSGNLLGGSRRNSDVVLGQNLLSSGSSRNRALKGRRASLCIDTSWIVYNSFSFISQTDGEKSHPKLTQLEKQQDTNNLAVIQTDFRTLCTQAYGVNVEGEAETKWDYSRATERHRHVADVRNKSSEDIESKIRLDSNLTKHDSLQQSAMKLEMRPEGTHTSTRLASRFTDPRDATFSSVVESLKVSEVSSCIARSKEISEVILDLDKPKEISEVTLEMGESKGKPGMNLGMDKPKETFEVKLGMEESKEIPGVNKDLFEIREISEVQLDTDESMKKSNVKSKDSSALQTKESNNSTNPCRKCSREEAMKFLEERSKEKGKQYRNDGDRLNHDDHYEKETQGSPMKSCADSGSKLVIDKMNSCNGSRGAIGIVEGLPMSMQSLADSNEDSRRREDDNRCDLSMSKVKISLENQTAHWCIGPGEESCDTDHVARGLDDGDRSGVIPGRCIPKKDESVSGMHVFSLFLVSLWVTKHKSRRQRKPGHRNDSEGGDGCTGSCENDGGVEWTEASKETRIVQKISIEGRRVQNDVGNFPVNTDAINENSYTAKTGLSTTDFFIEKQYEWQAASRRGQGSSEQVVSMNCTGTIQVGSNVLTTDYASGIEKENPCLLKTADQIDFSVSSVRGQFSKFPFDAEEENDGHGRDDLTALAPKFKSPSTRSFPDNYSSDDEVFYSPTALEPRFSPSLSNMYIDKDSTSTEPSLPNTMYIVQDRIQMDPPSFLTKRYRNLSPAAVKLYSKLSDREELTDGLAANVLASPSLGNRPCHPKTGSPCVAKPRTCPGHMMRIADRHDNFRLDVSEPNDPTESAKMPSGAKVWGGKVGQFFHSPSLFLKRPRNSKVTKKKLPAPRQSGNSQGFLEILRSRVTSENAYESPTSQCQGQAMTSDRSASKEGSDQSTTPLRIWRSDRVTATQRRQGGRFQGFSLGSIFFLCCPSGPTEEEPVPAPLE